jgi:hypothetical protein
VINGVQNAVNAAGEVYQVPLGFDQYWRDALGRFYGGSWASQGNPNWEELRPTGI